MSEKELIQKAKEDLNLDLSPEVIQKLKQYCDFLLEYNKHTNLTAIKTPELVYLKHFYDSLTLQKVVQFQENQKVLDIGTGAGFPGMIIAITNPNVEVHLLDSNHKKIDFLNELIQKLDLSNVKTIHERSEEYAKKHIEEYDIITSRAVAELRILIEISFPLLKITGLFIAMKSSIEDELKDSEGILESVFGNIEQIENFSLPNDSGIRNIIKIKKMKKTPNTYPRSYATILKKTLKKQQL